MDLVPSILLTNIQAVEELVQELMFWKADLPSPKSLNVLPKPEFKFISLNNRGNALIQYIFRLRSGAGGGSGKPYKTKLSEDLVNC